MLESAVAYVPIEDVLLGVLNAGDVPDIAAALAPAALRIEAPVNGRNIRLAAAEAQRALEIARTAYREAGTPDRLVIQSEPEDISGWLIGHLKQPGSRPGR